jgi:hypothetical protein
MEFLMRHSIAIFALLCIVSFTLLACSGQDQNPLSSAASGQTATSTSTSTPVSTQQTNTAIKSNTASSVQPVPIKSTLSSTIVSFYQRLEAKKYSNAYKYVGSNARVSGQKVTEASFVRMAQVADSTSGPINNFTFIADSTNHSQIIVTISRASGAHYHSHLLFQQEKASWKIIQIDII